MSLMQEKSKTNLQSHINTIFDFETDRGKDPPELLMGTYFD